MQRKGQAAMEFLMTYGWAILAAIIAIGVLAYFGVFSPGKFVPSATVVNPPLYANAWNVVDATGVNPDTISIEVKNNGGDKLNIADVNLANIQVDGQTYTCTETTAIDLTDADCGDLDPGELCTAIISCDDTGGTLLVAGDTVKADLSILYTKSPGGLQLSSSGTFASTAV